ncbi:MULTISPECIES: hypothetical protein [Halobacterium]|uniref:Uncharacterized protein n=1 Tax=Halobacterium salinarum TaxID=2242 RepID=A0A841HDD0_HALSI|nr:MULTISPECIES: hypothetical protein [Halobacterium]MBB6090292.1 hypothetical protein [Halobacterium salinarum]MDL0118987.1 hypothetical protein [Halobacterium salinarum]MDL0127372.1 hypothetical protein [Halobacterium salinarum]MDL0131131.1 hypothetical protein [Halobacterium salinarum]MDL0133503.1 hypothetical protein [Halobacterium salinarum]
MAAGFCHQPVVRQPWTALSPRSATEFGDDLGAHSGEIQRAGWFDGAPTNTADRVDAAAMLRDCRID